MLTTLHLLALNLNPGAEAPPGLGGFGTDFLAWIKWGGLIAGVLGLTVCAVMMMVGRRNRSSMAVDGAAGVPWTLAGLSVIAAAAGIVTTLAT